MNSAPTPQLVYVENAKLYVMLLDGKIQDIQKSTSARIKPHAIRVDELDVTTVLTNVHTADRNDWTDKSKLDLDGADLATFAGWLHSQMPGASPKAFGKAMFGYFAGSMLLRDVLSAVGWAAGVPGMRQPAGEERYFIEKIRASDPDGFAEMAAEYAK
jgi:hypothetical protein